MQENKSLIEGAPAGSESTKNSVAKYAAYYPLILLTLAVFLGAAYYYVRITPPKYQATAMLMIKTNDQDYGSKDLVSNALNGKQYANISKEVVQLKGQKLMQRVVAKYGFNTSYFLKGKVLTTDIYKNAPFQLIVKDLKDSVSTLRLTLTALGEKGGTLFHGSEENQQQYTFGWNTPFKVKQNTYVLIPKEGMDFDFDATYLVRWRSVAAEAGSLSGKLDVEEDDEGSNILTLVMTTENLKKCEDILNAVCTEYNLSDIEERNKLSESTVRFIDERLNVISSELKGVEGNLESYQGSRNLIDIRSQADQSFSNSNEISNNIKELNIKQGIVAMISGYFRSNNNSGKNW